MNTQLKKGALELCVLAQLIAKDQYGYELTEAISTKMSIASGTLYLILKRLKDEDYVETYLVESAEGPARKYYHITETGMEYYYKLKSEWDEFVIAVSELMNGC
jgi:PadR family transcriptional regulator PadR